MTKNERKILGEVVASLRLHYLALGSLTLETKVPANVAHLPQQILEGLSDSIRSLEGILKSGKAKK